jgi:hypothetical protein
MRNGTSHAQSEVLMDCSSISEMAKRLEGLERQGRRWRQAGMACILTLAVTSVAGSARRDEALKVIRSAAFSVVNDEGREVIRIGSNPQERGEGLVEILDKAGKPRIRMGLTASDSPFHMLLGQNPRDQLILDAIPEGGVGIRLKDLEHDSGLLLATSPAGIGAMGIMSPGGKLVLDMGVNPDGTSRLVIRDVEGKELVRLPKQ